MCAAGECMFCHYRQVRIAVVETRSTAQGPETKIWETQVLPAERNMAGAVVTERQHRLSSC